MSTCPKRVPRRGPDRGILDGIIILIVFQLSSMRMVMVCQCGCPGWSDARRPAQTPDRGRGLLRHARLSRQSVDEVAEQAGYTKARSNSNFASKADLFFGGLERRVEHV